jgi:hypothetical protein
LDLFEQVELLLRDLDSVGFSLLLWGLPLSWGFDKFRISLLFLTRFILTVYPILALLVDLFNNADPFLKKDSFSILSLSLHLPQLLNFTLQSIDITSDLLCCGLINIIVGGRKWILLGLCFYTAQLMVFLVE